MFTQINYADTVAVYTNYRTTTKYLVNSGWRRDQPHKKDIFPVESWFYKANNVYLRYYPSLYGKSLLYITFSLPKIYNDSNNNCSNVINFNSDTLNLKLRNVLKKFIDISQIPYSILDWQISRLDLFYTHIVPLQYKDYYFEAYKLLYFPRHSKRQYKHTTYLMSNFKKYKSASSVIRIYDKDIEMFERGILNKVNTLYYPLGVHEDAESAIEIEDDEYLLTSIDLIPYSRVRLEFQLRRRKLLYELKRKSVTLRDVFNKTFQIQIINKYLQRLGLNRKILSKYNFRNYMDTKNFNNSKRNSMIECARLIRNKKVPYNTATCSKSTKRISKSTFNSYINDLKKDNIHIVTTRSINLHPINLL